MSNLRLVTATLLIAALFALPVPATAQESGGVTDDGSSDSAVLLIPHGGAYLPGVDGIGDIKTGVDSLLGGRDMTLVLGGTLQFASPDGPVNFRISGVRTTSSVVSTREIGDTRTRTEDFMALTGDLVLRPIPRFLVQPYVLGGAGAYGTEVAGEGADLTDTEQWNFVGKVGGGVDVRVGTRGVVVSAEVVDYLSGFGNDGGVSHDALALVGLGVPIF